MLSEMHIRTGIQLRDMLDAGERIRALLELDEVASFAAGGGTRGSVLDLSAQRPD